ncbi:MAG TPA: hypothetical protein PKZ53_21480 [Acidobacteriota bacterium]|nr:hypothetical protein [Acidobacteriota bacterium]
MHKVPGLGHFQLKPWLLTVSILLCGANVAFATPPKSKSPQNSSTLSTGETKSNFKAPPKDLFVDESQIRKSNPVELVPNPPLPERQQLYRNGVIKGPTPLVQYLINEVDIVGMYRTQKSTGAMLKIKGNSTVIGARVGDLFFNGSIQQILVYTDKRQGDEGRPALLPGQPAGEIRCNQVTRYSDDNQQQEAVTLTYIPRR